MKLKTFLILLITFVYCLNLNLRDENIDIISLDREMSRQEYLIKLNKNYKIENKNSTYKYFIEIKDASLGDQNKHLKKINLLANFNSSIEINSEDREYNVTIYVTSILNEIDTIIFDRPNIHTTIKFERNGLMLLYSREEFDQILDLGSFENSLKFYYTKYDFEKTNPKEFNPVNKALFTKYDDTFVHIDNSSIYIIYMEIYKLDYFFNILDIFIAPKQSEQEINLESDKLYLQSSEDSYKISFNKSEFGRIMKLSKKTNMSVVTAINGTTILDEEHPYFVLTDEYIANGIELNVTENDCLIEILFSSENSEILDQDYLNQYKLTKPITLIKVPKQKTVYAFTLSSQNTKNISEFNIGFNHKISTRSYFYNWYTVSAPVQGSFELTLKAPYLYNLDMDEDEYQLLEIILNEEQLNTEIYLSYNPISYYSFLLLPMPQEKCESIKSNISSIINKYYVYKDLAKKPPEIPNLKNYHHEPIDMIKAIDEIPTENQTYLSFYQSVDYVLNFVRDGHLNIQMRIIEGMDLSTTILVLPFIFYIETDKNEKPIMKMTPYGDVIGIIPNKELFEKFLKDHADIPIKSINKTDPYDYIENLGIFQKFRNRHAQFTYNLKVSSRFSALVFPYDYSQLINIEIEFENGDTFIYDYIPANTKSFSVGGIDQREFEEFHINMVNNQQNPLLIPDILTTRKLFMKQKGLLLNEEVSDINWNYSTSDNYLKCRVDEKRGYNVFYQRSFSFNNIYEAINVMVKCSELFYSNNYKIIGIENLNGGGYASLYEVWHQLIQMKTLDKTYRALLRNSFIDDYMTKYEYYSSYANAETCRYLSSGEELGEYTDNYGYSDVFGYDITHNRTGIYDFLDKVDRKRLEKFRKNILENKKKFLKNSTDILIYTDAYSFSATSGFLKAFQNTGGAIIVGYNGNPKIEGTSEFDASQSSSSVTAFQCDEYFNLQNNGFRVKGITYSESYDDSWRNKSQTPIPREYTVDLVDERVPIYSSYTDDIYDKFIKEADKIFENYETKCSKNDPRLLLEDESCQLNEHEHGGHPCGENGEWDLNKCEAYYCDPGYYYDTYNKKCILDICTNGNETNIYLDDSYNQSKEFNIKPGDELDFYIDDYDYYYFFEGSSENMFTYFSDYMYNQNNFFMIQYEEPNVDIYEQEVYVNYHQNLKENATVKVTAIPLVPNTYIAACYVYDSLQLIGYDISNSMNRYIYGLETGLEHIIYFISFFKDTASYYASFKKGLSPQEIINIDNKKFDLITNKLIITEENVPGIFAYQTSNNFSNSYLNIIRKDIEQNIDASSLRFIYLTQRNFDYNLYFSSNSGNFYIRLVNETLDAEIEILDGSNKIINRQNRYAFFDKNATKVSLRLKNDNSALIEIAYHFTIKDENILDINETDYDLEKGTYGIICKKSDNILSIKLSIQSDDRISGLMFANIGKKNYISPYPSAKSTNLHLMETEIIVPNKYMDDDEEFVIYINIAQKFNLKLEIEEVEPGTDTPTDVTDIPTPSDTDTTSPSDTDTTSPSDTDEKPNESSSDDFPVYAIVLISVGGVIIIALILFFIIHAIRKNRVENFDSQESASLLKEVSDAKDQ